MRKMVSLNMYRYVLLIFILMILGGCQTPSINEDVKNVKQTSINEDESEKDEQELEANSDLTIPSLSETFYDYFPIGAAIEPHQISNETSELLIKHVNMLVAENVMKPDAIQPTEGNFNWEPTDRIIEFAKEHNMEVRFHTLVWHSQVGDWFFKDEDGYPMIDEENAEKREQNKQLLLERLKTHVTTIVERYKDDISSWDVVNEVVEPQDEDGMRASEWYQITGTEYIETAFYAAREAGGPDIKLYLNDYGTDHPKKRNIIYDLVSELLEKGVPIDGIGHQTHIDIHGPTIASIMESINKFNELGLDNIITELDMSIYAWDDHQDFGNEIPLEILNKQAERYEALFHEFVENQDKISEVVFWGMADDHTWLHSFPVERTNAPLLFDFNHQPKPAFWSVVNIVRDEE